MITVDTYTIGVRVEGENAQAVAKALRLVVRTMALDTTDMRGCTVDVSDPLLTGTRQEEGTEAPPSPWDAPAGQPAPNRAARRASRN